MDDTRVCHLIAQFLVENGYKNTLDALEKESGVKFVENQCKKTSELISILEEHNELTRERLDSKKLDILPGDGNFCNNLLLELPGIVGGINVLSVRLSSNGILFVGSCQGLLSVLELKAPLPKDASHLPIPVEIQAHSAGLIAMDLYSKQLSHLLLTGSMDRKCCLFEMTQGNELKLLQAFEDHNKFVVKVRWATSGKNFVTASYDETICIYRETMQEDKLEFNLLKQMKFVGQVEGISFKNEQDILLVSVRNDNYLHLIDVTLDDPQEIRTINMNLLGDDFVSFTAMDISFSPDDNFILVSTDKNRLIVFDFHTGDQLANFYGSLNDEFSQPRSCWHSSGKYIYSTSQDKSIIVWEVASQSVVTKLHGHGGMVRDLWFCEPLSVLLSCGFDGAVYLWCHRETHVD